MAFGRGCTVTVSSHVFDLNTVAAELVHIARAKKKKRMLVLIEAPEGFTAVLDRIAEGLVDCTAGDGIELEYVLRLEPAFGACDIGFVEASLVNADAVVHVGHSFYPYRLYAALRPVLYLPGTQVYDDAVVGELGEKLLDLIREGPVVVSYAAQNKEIANQIANYMRANSIQAVVVNDVVLGCYVAHIVKEVNRANASAVLVVAGGRFHALGVGLALAQRGIDVYRVDPYLRVVEHMAPVVEKTLRVRYWKIAEALSAKKFGLIVGVKPGQYRPWILNYLVKLMEKKGKRYAVLASNRLLVSDIVNLGEEYDAYTVTSCPRLAIEDLSEHPKPVLTPGETRMLLEERLDTYLFPW